MMKAFCGDRLRRRVVRGGSFNNSPRNVRCAYRNRNNPNNRNNNVGFRVVAVSHSFSASWIPEPASPRIRWRLRLPPRGVKAGAVGSWPRLFPIFLASPTWRGVGGEVTGRANIKVSLRPTRLRLNERAGADSLFLTPKRFQWAQRRQAVLEQIENVVEAALSAVREKRVAELLPRLDAAAEDFREGEPADSPWLDAASFVAAVAAQLRGDPAPLMHEPQIEPHFIQMGVGGLQLRQTQLPAQRVGGQ